MSKLKLIILILVELKSRRLAAEVRRKKVIKMIVCKRKLFKHKYYYYVPLPCKMLFSLQWF